MKRDMDLARKILFALEEAPSELGTPLSLDGYSEEAIGYHVWLLGEAGLLKVVEITHSSSLTPEALPQSLTWAGHDFLDAARNDTTWSKAMDKAKSVGGGLSFAVLKQFLEFLMKSQLGL